MESGFSSEGGGENNERRATSGAERIVNKFMNGLGLSC